MAINCRRRVLILERCGMIRGAEDVSLEAVGAKGSGQEASDVSATVDGEVLLRAADVEVVCGPVEIASITGMVGAERLGKVGSQLARTSGTTNWRVMLQSAVDQVMLAIQTEALGQVSIVEDVLDLADAALGKSIEGNTLEPQALDVGGSQNDKERGEPHDGAEAGEGGQHCCGRRGGVAGEDVEMGQSS